jgi:hypothetical protein
VPGSALLFRAEFIVNAFEQAVQNIRRSSEQGVQLQAIQMVLLADMSATMGSIHSEIAQVRKQNADILAIQQELLARERLQAYLEELIYQTQKLVAECSKANTNIPPSTRFFLLRGVLLHIKQEAIATPIIKGRDNKAAFDQMVSEANALGNQLRKDPAVRKAITWAKQLEDQRHREQKREQEEQEREREREQAEREREKARLATRHRWITAITLLTILGVAMLPFVLLTIFVGSCCVSISNQNSKRNK